MKTKLRGRSGTIGLILLMSSCYYYEDIPRLGIHAQCVDSDLDLTVSSHNVSGCDHSDGAITASPSGGTSPYLFSLNGGPKQATASFENLKGGTYVVTVFDAKTCQASAEVILETSGTTFSAAVKTIIPDTDCFGTNGSVELTAAGGNPPYEYSLGPVSGTSAIFNNVAAGTYNATVRDAGACEVSLAVVIPNGVSTSYEMDINPILGAKCNFAGCHASGTGKRDFTVFDNVKASAGEIKIRTADGTMPKNPKPGGTLSTDQIKRIACWVDEGANNN